MRWGSRLGWMVLGIVLGVAGVVGSLGLYLKYTKYRPWIPTARNDRVITAVGTPIEIDALKNDDPGLCIVRAEDPSVSCPRLDPPASNIRIVGMNPTGAAAAQVTERGTLLFTPSPDYSGMLRFWYQMRDTWGRDSIVAHVEVAIGEDKPWAAAR